MAVERIAPKCPICGEEYEAIYSQIHSSNFIGDSFVMWDTVRHVCPPDEGHVFGRYEERLEKIVDLIRNVTTVEAISILSKYVAKLPNEE